MYYISTSLLREFLSGCKLLRRDHLFGAITMAGRSTERSLVVVPISGSQTARRGNRRVWRWSQGIISSDWWYVGILMKTKVPYYLPPNFHLLP